MAAHPGDIPAKVYFTTKLTKLTKDNTKKNALRLRAKLLSESPSLCACLRVLRALCG